MRPRTLRCEKHYLTESTQHPVLHRGCADREENKAEYKLEIALGTEFRRENKLLYMPWPETTRASKKINRFLSDPTPKISRSPSAHRNWRMLFVIIRFCNAAEIAADNES